MSEDIKAKVKSALTIVQALADMIRELKQVPSGHLYARVMERMDLETYEGAIRLLENSDVIRKQGDLLIWNIEP